MSADNLPDKSQNLSSYIMECGSSEKFELLLEKFQLIFFFIRYFGLQDTKPPPCPLHLTEQGGSIRCLKLYCHTLHRLVSYILTTISIYCIMA